MKPIVTITVNPAIDESTSVNHVIAERKLRCKPPVYEPGGGGINVSRVIKILGGETIAIYLVGGHTGRMFQELLTGTGIVCRPIWIEGLTRIDLMVIEESSGREYRFGMPGPLVKEEEWRRCLEELVELEPRPDYVVASGSLPRGVTVDFYRRVARICHESGSRLVVDTSGQALHEILDEGVYLLKPNINEMRDLTGKEFRNESQLEQEALKLVRSGKVEVLVVSLGAAGALLVSREGVHRIRAPTVPIVSKVGAGDSTVAGIVISLARGMSMEDSVYFGVAAGSAAVMTPGSGLCRREDVERLFEAMMTQKV